MTTRSVVFWDLKEGNWHFTGTSCFYHNVYKHSPTIMIEAAGSCETSVCLTQTRWCHMPEDSHHVSLCPCLQYTESNAWTVYFLLKVIKVVILVHFIHSLPKTY